MRKISVWIYVTALVVLTAYCCSFLTFEGVNGWYAKLSKPPLTPPNKVFPPVWNILYLLLIIGAGMVLSRLEHPFSAKANGWLLLQAFLQLLWCWTIFAGGMPGWGLVVLLLLDITVVQMTANFTTISTAAGVMQIPLLIWCLFATYLNTMYVWMYGVKI